MPDWNTIVAILTALVGGSGIGVALKAYFDYRLGTRQLVVKNAEINIQARQVDVEEHKADTDEAAVVLKAANELALGMQAQIDKLWQRVGAQDKELTQCRKDHAQAIHEIAVLRGLLAQHGITA